MTTADLAGAGKAPKNGCEKIGRIGQEGDFASRRPGQARQAAEAVHWAVPTGRRANGWSDGFVLYGLYVISWCFGHVWSDLATARRRRQRRRQDHHHVKERPWKARRHARPARRRARGGCMWVCCKSILTLDFLKGGVAGEKV